MEKAKFPMQVLNISQGYDEGTHKGTYALDLSGNDKKIDLVKSPFTGIIKAIDKKNGNFIWLESIEEVKCPNGDVTKLVAMFGHCNNIDKLKIGDIIKQNEYFYSEGTAGITNGNHCHLEIGKGEYVGKWYKNSNNIWQLYNAVKPNEYLFLSENTVVKNDYGYLWKKEKGVTNIKYLNLSPKADSWRVYDLNVKPIKGNEKSVILPSKFNGLSYTILEIKNENIAIIETRDFGKVQIYIGNDVKSMFEITDKPLYGVVK